MFSLSFADSVLLCSAIAGIGYFLTDSWKTLWLTLHEVDVLEEGGSLVKTAAIGAGMGCVSALASASVTMWWQAALLIVASAAWATHGRCLYLAAYQAYSNPRGWFTAKVSVSVMDALLSRKLSELYDNPKELQSYLDRTYGKGIVMGDSIRRVLGPKPKSETNKTLH